MHIYPWDAAEHLKTKEDIAAYWEAALEDGDPALLTAALADIARSEGLADIARETGLNIESSREALSRGDLELATVVEMIQAIALP